MRYLLALSLCLMLCAATTMAADKIYFVATDGDNANDGRSVESPFLTIRHAVGVMTGGDTLYLRGGTYRDSFKLDAHRHRSSVDKPTRILAYEDERPVIKGSIVVENWERHEGDIWKRTGWEGHTQTLFVDFDKAPLTSPLRQVGTAGGKNDSFRSKFGSGVADMVAGSFFCDIENKVLYVWLADGSDPNQHVIEAGHLTRLLTGNVRGNDATQFFLIRGLTFYHSNASVDDQFLPAIEVPRNSVMENCVVQWMDFAGVDVTGGSILRNTDISYNGGVGIQVRGHHHRWLITGNRVNDNNWRRFDTAHHAGGMKIIPDGSGTVEANEVARNNGSGIWFDYCRTKNQIVIRNNLVHNNMGRIMDGAIKIEAADNTTVVNNLIVNNRGNGLLIFGCENSRVFHNTIVGNEGMAAIQLGGIPRQKLKMENTLISNNLVADNHTTWDIMLQDDGGTRNNWTSHNLVRRFGGPLQLNTGGTYTGFQSMITNLETWREARSEKAPRSGEGTFDAAPRFALNATMPWRPLPDCPSVGRGTSLSDYMMEVVVPAKATVGTELATVPVVADDATGRERSDRPALGALEPARPADLEQKPRTPLIDFPGPAVDTKPAADNPHVWVDDFLPRNARLGMQQPWIRENPIIHWNWTSAIDLTARHIIGHPGYPKPASGIHAVDLRAGRQRPGVMYFYGSEPSFTVGAGESLSLLVYIDPRNPPRQIAVQVRAKDQSSGDYPRPTASWNYGLRLGADAIDWLSHLPLREGLPEAGAWVELRLPAAELGFADRPLIGLALTAFDGRAVFDRIGRVVNDAPIAAPVPVEITDKPDGVLFKEDVQGRGPAGSPFGDY